MQFPQGCVCVHATTSLQSFNTVVRLLQHSPCLPVCLFNRGAAAPLLVVCACSGVDLGVDLDSRVAIVGANGTGKSTLLKLMTGQLEPLDGLVKRHNHLRIGVYHQHLVRQGQTVGSVPLRHLGVDCHASKQLNAAALAGACCFREDDTCC